MSGLGITKRLFGGKGREGRSIFGYVPGTSFLHKLDPRTKILGLIAVTSATFITADLIPMLIPFLFVILVAIFAGQLKGLLRGYIFFIPLLVFVLLADSFFAGEPSGTVYFAADFWILHPTLTSGRISFATAMGLRLLAIGGFSILCILTTEYTTLVKSLRSMKFPPTFSFSLGYALRSITGLTNDLRHIMDAQRSRGLEFDRDTFLKARNTLMAVSVPMTVSMLKRSQHVSDAMQSRGFGGPAMPTVYRPVRFGKMDLAMITMYVLLIAVVVLIR
jgi:energy-coupling factor transport system permease protein